MKILIVEDEKRMGQLLVRGLTEEGHLADHCPTGADALEQLACADYDVMVLDWGLPDRDGLSLLRELRSQGIMLPILMLTARGSSGERVLGLRTGADDYLVKPFAFDELLARLEALHRRTLAFNMVSTKLGDVDFQKNKRELLCGSKRAFLTGREFQLLSHLAKHVGDVCTRAELLTHVWGHHFDGDPNVVDVYIRYLRSKLDEVGAEKLSLHTVRGSGYRLVVAYDSQP